MKKGTCLISGVTFSKCKRILNSIKRCNFIWLIFSCLLLGFSCKNKDESTPAEDLAGLVLNEICGSQESEEDSWIELLNTTDRDINISGIKITLTDDYFFNKKIYSAAVGTVIGSGKHKLLSLQDGNIDTDISAKEAIEICLVAADGTVIDKFIRNTDVNKGQSHAAGGSYSRLPDGIGQWFVTSSATRDEENFGYTNRNGIWMWSTHLMNAPLANLANKGIRHLILHEQAFKSYSEEQVLARIAEAEKLGMIVHIWLQCFYDGEWISPVDDVNQRYDQELFDEIIARAEKYLKMDIKGIHLDYIRFGGSAHLHNHPNGVTGEGAITEFCKQISEKLKAVNKHVILSAALMWERQSAYYYGQNSSDMGQYMDILMPMIYKYEEDANKTASWAKSTADYFAENSGGAEVWAGLQTYKYVSGNVTGLSEEQMLIDCQTFVDSKAKGVMLFRFGLGYYPDINGLWD